MPVNESEDSNWIRAGWSDDDVRAVKIAVGEDDGDVVREGDAVGMWGGGGASAAGMEVVVEGGDGKEGARGMASAGEEDIQEGFAVDTAWWVD